MPRSAKRRLVQDRPPAGRLPLRRVRLDAIHQVRPDSGKLHGQPKFFFKYHSLHLHYVSPIDGMASIIFYYMETLDHANLSCLAPFSTYHLMPREKPSEKHLALLPRRRESNPGRLRSKLLRYPLLHHPSARCTKDFPQQISKFCSCTLL